MASTLSETPVTAVEAELSRRRRAFLPLQLLAALIALLGLAATALGAYLLWRLAQDRTPYHANIVEHYKYGSIGAEIESGLPYWVWQALPRLFPESFDNRADYRSFGFLYENGPDGRARDLPVGIARREVNGVELVWFNCAVCHAGTYRERPNGPTHLVMAMPSNNLDLHRFIRFLLDAGADERLAPEQLIPAMQASGADLNALERLFWRFYVIPQVREGLVKRRSRLSALLEEQPRWGPGRVDTFNPYKLIIKGDRLEDLAPAERIGTADFPAVFKQGPRRGMSLHWDGNNPSLEERNLSAALGAGVTPTTVDHDAIGRVSNWLLDLSAPPSPYRPDPAAVARGRAVYGQACAECHGHQEAQGYVFSGKYLGQVEPNGRLGVDPHRLDSYTEPFQRYQVSELFKGTPYQFRHFRKTDGYANLPLDGLWLRAPYLHNGTIPTLEDLLKPPAERPVTFVRGLDLLDPANGGFLTPPCNPAQPRTDGICFDTRLPGNGNQGHDYGSQLLAEAKSDLLAYLLTF
jgi:cytochrome c5